MSKKTPSEMPPIINSDSGFTTLGYFPTSQCYVFDNLSPAASFFLGLTSADSPTHTVDLNTLSEDVDTAQIIEVHNQVYATGEAVAFSWKYANRSTRILAGTAFQLSENTIALVFRHQKPLPPVLLEDSRLLEWEKTVNSIDDIITIQDSQMRIVRANKAAHQLFGYNAGELTGKRCHKAFYDRETPCDNCPLTETLRDSQTHRGNRYSEDTGRIFNITSSPLFNEHNELNMVILVARDITSSVIQEEERKRLSTAIEQASEAIIITNRHGIVQYINPAFSASTGYGHDEAIGANIKDLERDGHNPQFHKQLWDHLLTGKVWSGKFTNIRKDGSFYSAQSTISPVFDDNQQITAFVAVQRDNSKEESLEKQLQQAIKLEAIGTLAGGIAHDFNNILSAMIGYAQVARGYAKNNHQALYAIDHILSSGDRAADLIKQILTFSRQNQASEPFKPLKIQYILKSVLTLIRSSLPSTIKLSQDISNECSSILADASQIHQVVMNLCTNARQAIGENHGEITVHLSEKFVESSTGDPAQPQLPAGRYAFLEITDTGCGMDEHIIKRIFDPFFSTKPKEHGTGLGLSVVHGIISKHNSTIAVSSAPNQGTTFSLHFPTLQIELPTPPEATQKLVVGGTERILLVDDEQQIIDFLEVALKRLGYKVSSFCDSMEAVQFFRENSNDIDLVLTDMTMPNMTGAELAREVLSIRHEIPIILTTGFSESINKEKALRIGIAEFLTKPLRKDELAQSIRNVLDHG